MPRVKYIGPFDEIEIPSLAVIIAHDEVFEVPAEAVGPLCQQADFEPNDKAAKDLVKAHEAELAAAEAEEAAAAEQVEDTNSEQDQEV